MDILGFYSRKAVDKSRVGYLVERKQADAAMQFISDEDGVYFVKVSKNVVDNLIERPLGPVTVQFKSAGNGQIQMDLTHYSAPPWNPPTI